MSMIIGSGSIEPEKIKSPLSFIEPHEEQKAKELINEHIFNLIPANKMRPGLELPRPAGWKMVIKPYIRPEDVHQLKDDDGNVVLGPDGKPLFIALPESVRADDKWKTLTALVIAQGPLCYKGERYKEGGLWCKVGDWIYLPRNEGSPFSFMGIPMKTILDDSIDGITQDPTDITMA